MDRRRRKRVDEVLVVILVPRAVGPSRERPRSHSERRRDHRPTGYRACSATCTFAAPRPPLDSTFAYNSRMRCARIQRCHWSRSNPARRLVALRLGRSIGALRRSSTSPRRRAAGPDRRGAELLRVAHVPRRAGRVVPPPPPGQERLNPRPRGLDSWSAKLNYRYWRYSVVIIESKNCIS
jgi:hypothetical protein